MSGPGRRAAKPRWALIRYAGDPNRMQTTIEITADRKKAREFCQTQPRLMTPAEAGLDRVLVLSWYFEVRLLPPRWRRHHIQPPYGSTLTQEDLLAQELRKVAKRVAPCDLDDESSETDDDE